MPIRYTLEEIGPLADRLFERLRCEKEEREEETRFLDFDVICAPLTRALEKEKEKCQKSK